jgi:hypothetical protein
MSLTSFDNVKHDANFSKYRYTRIALNSSSGSTVTVGTSSVSPMDFKLPAKTCYNLSRSYVQYQYSIPASGTAGTYACVNNLSQDLCSTIYFGDGGGKDVVNLLYADRFTNVTQPMRTRLEDVLTTDPKLQTCGASNLVVTAGATGNTLPFSRDGLTAGTANASNINYTEPLYLQVANNAILNISRQVSLSVFKDTALAMDKSTIWGTDMYLRMNTQTTAQMAWYTSSIATPHIGTNATAVASFNLTGVYLYLALEENRQVIDSLTSALMSNSIRLRIPYIYAWKTTSTGTVANFSYTLSRQFGKKVKYLLTAPFNINENLGYYHNDHSNVNGTKVLNIQTYMDSRPLQDSALNCFNPAQSGIFNQASPLTYADDWREMRKFCKGSAIQTYDVYQTNWSYADVFGLQPFDVASNKQLIPDENISDGFSLGDGDHIYSVTCQTPNPVAGTSNSVGLAMYTFALFEREIQVGPNTFDLVA